MKSLIQTDNQFSGSVYIGDNVSDIHYLKGSIYIGDGGVTNYSKFESTGKLTITGSGRVYNTIYIPAYSMIPDGAYAPTIFMHNSTPYYSFESGALRYLYFNTILPNDYAEGTDVAFSIYYLSTDESAIDSTFIWFTNCGWSNPNGSFSGLGSIPTTLTVSATNRNLRGITTAMSGAGKVIGSTIGGLIYRDDENVDISSAIYLLGIGVNYLVDGFGSTNRFTK